MEMFLNEIPDRTHGEHDVDERRHQRQQNLENDNVRQRHPSQRALAGENSTVLINSLQDAEGPPKTLRHQGVRVGGSLGVAQGMVFFLAGIPGAKKGHGELASSATVS